VPTEGIDAPAASPEVVPPTEPGIEKNADAQASPAPEAETPPQTSKNTKTKTKAETRAETGNRNKTKSQPKPKRTRTESAGADKHAAEEPGAAGDTGTAAAADEGAPVMTYLRGARIEPGALPPPAATLPPQLASLFPDMASVSAVLAVTAAAAGRGVHLDTNKNGEGSSLALRVAVVGEERRLPPAVAPVLQAAYALEAQDVQRWKADKTIFRVPPRAFPPLA
jgi:hypothetical protein